MHRDIGQTSSDYSYIMGQWSIACMNTKVFLTDGSPRQAAQSTITVFMVGDKGAGKSTLTKALMTEKEGIIRWTGRVSKVSGVKEKTGGQALSVAVGSHAVSVKSKPDLEEKQSLVHSLCKAPVNVHFVDYVTVDCRYSESPSLTQLRSHILIHTTHCREQHLKLNFMQGQGKLI